MPERYDAFISYSHAVDGQLASAVQRGLHRLAKPWYSLRALNVFRDKTGLAATPALWSSIQEALDESRYFILLASPEAANSQWVNRELDHWLTTKSPTNILVVVTDGHWGWNRGAGDFDWGLSTAIPSALKGVFLEEPLLVDLAWTREEPQLSLRHSRFRSGIADLAAPIHGRSRDELESDDIRQRRRALQLAGLALLGLVVLAVAAAIFGFQASRERNRADENADRAFVEAENAKASASDALEQRNRADEEARVSLSRSIASQAELLESEPDLALLLSLAAIDVDQSTFSTRTLLRNLANSHLSGFWRPSGGPFNFFSATSSVNADATLALFTRDDGVVELFDLAGRAPLVRRVLSFHDDTEEMGWNETLPEHHVAMPVISAELSSSGNTAIVSSLSGSILKWDLATDAIVTVTDDCGLGLILDLAREDAGAIGCVSNFRENDPYSSVTFFTLGGSDVVPIPTKGEVNGLALSAEGNKIASVEEIEPLVYELFIRDGTNVISRPLEMPGQLEFSPDGSILAVGRFDGTIELLDASTLMPRGLQRSAHDNIITTLAFSQTGEVLYSGDAAGAISGWALRLDGDTFELDRADYLAGHNTPVEALVPAGRDSLVSLSKDSVAWWNTGTTPVKRLATAESSQVFGVAALGPTDFLWATLGDGIFRSNTSDQLSGHWLSPPPNDAVWRFVGSEDGSRVAGGFQQVHVWDTRTQEKLVTLESDGGGLLKALAISPDGNTMAAGFQPGFGWLYNMDTAERIIVTRDGETFSSVDFAPSGETFAVAIGSEVRIYQTATAAELWRFKAFRSTASLDYSPDGTLLAVGGDLAEGRVALYDVANLNPVPLMTFEEPAAGVTSLRFSPSGRELVGGGADGRLYIWDPITGDRIVTIGQPQFAANVLGLEFLEDGLLVSGGLEGAEGPIIWDWRLDSLRAMACEIAGRDLTAQEWSRFLGDRQQVSLC